MQFDKINIGEKPSDGMGDPLRVAFDKINKNFETIGNIVTLPETSVFSVAGRSGNVILSINDVMGAVGIATLNANILTHTHDSSAITDFSNAVKDVVGNTLVAGENISIDYNNETKSTTIAASTRDAQLAVWMGM